MNILSTCYRKRLPVLLLTAGLVQLLTACSAGRPSSAYKSQNSGPQAVLDSSATHLHHLHKRVLPVVPQIRDTEKYQAFKDNRVRSTATHPVSTFSVDVDTGSYSNIRRFLVKHRRLPPADAVRIEEMVNYFDYDYAAPRDLSRPFTVTTEVAPAPWNRDTHLLHIGIKGYKKHHTSLPPANLVFLIDVSGSMQGRDRLDLLKYGFRKLVKRLRPVDRVSIVVYAGASGVVLPPTPGSDKDAILDAIDSLQPGGSTNGGAGIELAYALAKQNFVSDGINRVILATDGDFNVGVVDHNALIDLIRRKRKSGIGLTVLGFGAGNYNDRLMEQLADKGNGNYAYIDNRREARKVLVQQLSSTLLTIAEDVKLQVEFNPAVVAEYRLIGYVNRKLRREDFDNDKVDAGEIGAGHTVTALYEITLQNSKARKLPPLRYGRIAPVRQRGSTRELAFIKIRYKRPGTKQSLLIRRPVYTRSIVPAVEQASDDFRFSAAVAAFGQNLRGGRHTGYFGYQRILQLAGSARGADPYGYRREFLRLVRAAQRIDTRHQVDVERFSSMSN